NMTVGPLTGSPRLQTRSLQSASIPWANPMAFGFSQFIPAASSPISYGTCPRKRSTLMGYRMSTDDRSLTQQETGRRRSRERQPASGALQAVNWKDLAGFTAKIATLPFPCLGIPENSVV